MQKVKHDFNWQTKKYRLEMSTSYRIAFLDCNSCLTFKLSTVCGTLKKSALLISRIKLDRNHTMKEAIYTWSLTKRRKKTRKKFKQS